MPETSPSPAPPSAELIAQFVRLARGLADWKQETLAYMAGVSLSTVQRVERGEAVGADSLERIGAALRQKPGTLTTPRVPLSYGEAAEWAVENWGWILETQTVAVAPLRTQRQLRMLSETVLAMIDDDLGPEAADEIAGFREWMGLLSFVRAEQAGLVGGGDPRRLELRRLYGDVLRACAAIERRHAAVCLAGVYAPAHELPRFQGAQVAVVSFRSRRANPAVAQRRSLFAPKSISLGDALREALERDD
jgi:transcriptional regulator with XRE-family HTH domain